MRSLVLLLATFAFATSAPAAPNVVSTWEVSGVAEDFAPLTGEKRVDAIKRIEAYLTGISTLTADFAQTSSDGSTGSGQFFMKRPGKVRWQYNAPTPLLLLSNGKTLTYYDPGLKQVTYVDVKDTLASFVAQKTIELDGPATRLMRLEADKNGSLRATLIQRAKPEEGSMTLEFSDNPLIIKRMIAIDATGNETQVSLANPQFSKPLDNALFVFNDPRPVNERRNKR